MRIAAIIKSLRRIIRYAPGGLVLATGIFFSWFGASEVWARQEWMFKVCI